MRQSTKELLFENIFKLTIQFAIQNLNTNYNFSKNHISISGSFNKNFANNGRDYSTVVITTILNVGGIYLVGPAIACNVCQSCTTNHKRINSNKI